MSNLNPPWFDSESKQGCRDDIVTAATECLDRVHKIFTLPWKEVQCGKTFRKAWPNAAIVGVERELPIWRDIDYSCGIDVWQCSLGEYVRFPHPLQTHYDICNFDFVGPASRQNTDDVVRFLQNDNLVHPGKRSLLAFTFSSKNRIDTAEEYMQDIREHVMFDRNEIPRIDVNTVSCMVLNKIVQKIEPKHASIVARAYKADEDAYRQQMYFILMQFEKREIGALEILDVVGSQ